MGIRVAIAGGSGYAGGELLRLIDGHPYLELAAVTAHGHAGARLSDVHPHLVSLGDRVFGATDAAALPAAVKVVDLGADHRLTDPQAWARYYAGPHAGAWTYGLPELPSQRAAIAAASRVAAPGCYATAVVLALAPLLGHDVATPDDIVVVAASGTSGAGRTAKAHLLASEVMGDVSA